jgi:AcrR family transcriptional regulator
MLPERKACVLEAATHLFGQFGFKKTSIADIAMRAGCSKAAIYLLAPSKTALYFQILHDQISRCSAQSLAAIRVDLPAHVQLKELLALQLSWIHDEPLVRALFLENVENTMPSWRSQFAELRRLGRSIIVEVIHLGVRQGEFRADVDAHQVAAILQDLLIATLALPDREQDSHMESPRWQTTLDLLLHGLRIRSESISTKVTK